jgi:hypothetical protein
VVFNQGANSSASQSPQTIALNAVAKYVRFTITSNYGNDEGTSLSEVKFNSAAIPTPALLPGLVGLGMTALRKRREKGADVAA